MAGENIKLNTSNQGNFTAFNGCFYVFDWQMDSLLQKTDDGNTAFSYPLDILLGYTIKDAQYDGVYFWSEENPGGGVVYIKKWKIDNYVCKLQQTFTLNTANYPGHTFYSETFSVAHYHTALTYAVTSGSSTIYLDDYWDDSTLMNFTTTSGNKLTLHLGPNSSSQEEDVTISGVVASGVVLASGTLYAYDEDDEVNFFTHLWLFNDYNGTDSSIGALYKFDAYTGDYITKYANGAYKAVAASTFYNVDSFSDEYGAVDTLAYIKGTNTLFINVGAAGATLPYYGSMVMGNIQANQYTVINPVALTMDGQNVYRLQLKPDGSDSDFSGSTYNYQLSTLDKFVTSISMIALPATIAANTSSSSQIIVTVRDQFLNPVHPKTVYFSEDGDGSMEYGSAGTNVDGEATDIYHAGTTARLVKITALVNQSGS